ncbi:MAG: PBP1b-binding outer membrane lipoprotein LpoB, partial [Cognaticolwellia sp.]
MKHMALIPLAALLLVGCNKVTDEEEEVEEVEEEVVVDADDDGF